MVSTPFFMIYLNEVGNGTPRMNMMKLASLSIDYYFYNTSILMRKVVVIAGTNWIIIVGVEWIVFSRRIAWPLILFL